MNKIPEVILDKLDFEIACRLTEINYPSWEQLCPYDRLRFERFLDGNIGLIVRDLPDDSVEIDSYLIK